MVNPAVVGFASARADAYAYLVQTFDEPVLSPLSMAAVNRAGAIGGVGWSIPLPPDFAGVERELWFLLPAAFPDEAPLVRIEPSPFGVWPHASPDGNLCLWIDGLEPVGKTPREQAELALKAAGALLQLILPPADQTAIAREFDREWLSYWRTPGEPASQAFALLLGVPAANPCFIGAHALTTSDERRRIVLVADNDDLLAAWKEALNADHRSLRRTEALYVPLAHPLRAPPTSLTTLLQLLKTMLHLRDVEEFANRLEFSDGPFYVVFGYAGDDGHSFAAIELTLQSRLSPNGRGPYNTKEWHDRFVRRKRGAWRVKPMAIDRADPAWIHGRAFDLEAQQIADKHVWVIGCGSLGGLIIRGLASAGVGRLTLVDGESLEVPNLGRHVLTARSLGRPKAKALAEQLREQLPHLQVVPIAKDYPAVQPPSGIAGPDLVISATADWPTERRLMKALAAGEFAWLQLAWAEPHAIAGHAVIGATKSDLPSLFDADGRFRRRATEWNESSQPLPGCAGAHQPGTYNRLQRIAGLAVEQAISHLLGMVKPEHLLWLGDEAVLHRLGGKWQRQTAVPQGIRERTLALSVPERI